MGGKPHVSATWSLHGTLGDFQCGQLQGRVDSSRPSLGIQNLDLDHRRVQGNFLCVNRSVSHLQPSADEANRVSAWPLPVADTYVRVSDLVASYRPMEDWPYAPQLYWRTNPLESVDRVLASLCLLISVQTQLLDTL